MRLEVIQGETTGWEYPILDENGNPADLSGWRLIGDIRTWPGTPLIHRWDSEATTPNASVDTGLATITVSSTTSMDWSFGWAQFDLWLEKDGVRLPIDKDDIVVRRAVTID